MVEDLTLHRTNNESTANAYDQRIHFCSQKIANPVDTKVISTKLAQKFKQLNISVIVGKGKEIATIEEPEFLNETYLSFPDVLLSLIVSFPQSVDPKNIFWIFFFQIVAKTTEGIFSSHF